MKTYEVIIKESTSKALVIKAMNESEAVKNACAKYINAFEESLSNKDLWNICFCSHEIKSGMDELICEKEEDSNIVALKNSIRDFCRLLNTDEVFTEEELDDMIDDLPWDDFDPMKEIEFENIYTFKADATFAEPFIVKHGPIFDKRGVRVAFCEGGGYMGERNINEGIELWLLEDMSFAATHFCHMEVRNDPRKEEAIYRYPVDIRDAALYSLYVDDFLEDMQYIME